MGVLDDLSNWVMGTDSDTVSTDGQASTESSETSENTTVQEIPIVDYDEALAWGMRELGKQRRKSGHKIELKVIGNTDYKVGEWCRVYMPTYNEDCFMFISKASVEAGADEEFITSLTLVDYPPSLGAGEIQSNERGGETEESDSTTGSTDTSSTSSENTSNTENTDNGSES